MKPEITALLLAVSLGGIVATRIWIKRQERDAIAQRLARWAPKAIQAAPSLTLLKRSDWSRETALQILKNAPGIEELQSLLVQSGFEGQLPKAVGVLLALLIAPPLLAFLLNLDLAISGVCSLIIAGAPIIWLKARSEARRTKFCEQLPDAIDLMVAVLKSGHSIPQAVKAVAQEIPQPCGAEFEATLHRMNLGQRLSEAMVSSAQRFRSYELDLIRRAVAIQAEVGGSLAELLEKTNHTLRDRLKLVRQARVITSQSRLTAIVVGFLPVAVCLAMNFLSPGYMQQFVQDEFGRMLLIAAVVLELIGIWIMRRIARVKV